MKLPENNTLSAADIAHMCGVGKRTVWRWEAAGLMPRAKRMKCPRQVRWDRGEIEKWRAGR